MCIRDRSSDLVAEFEKVYLEFFSVKQGWENEGHRKNKRVFVIVCATQKTWHTMLTTKFKAERGKLRDDSEVLAARAKFGAKRKIAVSDAAEDSTAKRCYRPEVQYF